MDGDGYSRPAVAGSGAIAMGLAAAASAVGEVLVLARSEESAARAERLAAGHCEKLEAAVLGRVTVTTEIAALAECDLVVEAIVEDAGAKAELHSALATACPGADLATTTSSLGIGKLGLAAGAPGRLYGLHVFNPVPRMDLVELCLPDALDPGVAERARGFCAALGKTAVEVPDIAGFVVNRLLFPYLFSAVRLYEQSGMDPAEIDACMKLGAGHPMGPLGLIDFVGVDVAVAIGRSLAAETGESLHEPPATLVEMEAAGRLGRKSGAGFFGY
jgi:3-hydroxybutyryl-CoA dehydrogenase